jgi:hypothetical protein
MVMSFGFDQFKKIQKKIYMLYLRFVLDYMLDEGYSFVLDVLCLQPTSKFLYPNQYVLAAFCASISPNFWLYYPLYRMIFHDINFNVKISRCAYVLHIIYNLCIKKSYIPFILISILDFCLSWDINTIT